MSQHNDPQKYMVIVKVGRDDQPADANRALEVARKLVDEIKVLSDNDFQYMFSDSAKVTIGVLMRSRYTAGVIRARLSGDSQTARGPSILLNDDSVVVMALADDFSSAGRGLPCRLLQGR